MKKTALLLTIYLTVSSVTFSQSIIDELYSPSPERDGQFGSTILNLGDINSDGKEDYAISSRTWLNQTINPGRVLIISGDDQSILTTINSPNSISDGQFGKSIAIIDDLTSDGIPELLISAPREEVNTSNSFRDFDGRVYIVDIMSPNNLIPIICPSVLFTTYFGKDLCSLNDDQDNDGFNEFAISAERVNGGVVYIYDINLNQPNGVEIIDSIYSPHPEQNSEFGFSLSPLNDDINNNGANELLIGAYLEGLGTDPSIDFTNEGRVYVYDPKDKQILRLDTSPNPTRNGHFGISIDALNDDANNDGINDYVVGASGEGDLNGSPFGTGHVYIMSGSDGSPIKLIVSPKLERNGKFGRIVKSLNTDISNDNLNDIVISATEESVGFRFDAGRVYVMNPSDGSELVSFSTEFPQSFGSEIEVFGDINNNGFADIAIADEDFSNTNLPSFAGVVYFFDTEDTTVIGLNEIKRIEEAYKLTSINGIVQIKSILKTSSPSDLKIFDIGGKLIYDNQIGIKELKIDLSNETKGIYLIQIQNSGNYYSAKFFVE